MLSKCSRTAHLVQFFGSTTARAHLSAVGAKGGGAVQNTFDLYRYATEMMEEAAAGQGRKLALAQRFQTGLIIALLAARPLRIRNFPAIIRQVAAL